MFQSFKAPLLRDETEGKLKALREIMEKENLEGFLLPMTDSYQNEYIAPQEQRLKWLTNFSGSAGFALIFLNNAFLFTDSRYQIQIRKETNAQFFSYENTSQISIYSWLEKNVKNLCIGYDPWLHTHKEVFKINQKLLELNSQLIACNDNFIDRIRQDGFLQEDALLKKTAKAFIQPLSFAGQTAAEKIQNIKQEVDRKGAKAFIFTDPTSIAWLLNIRGNDIQHNPIVLCRALIFSSASKQEKDILFIDFDKIDADTHLYLSEFVILKNLEDFLPLLEDYAAKNIVLAFDEEKTPEKIYQTLLKQDAKICIMSDPVTLPRAIKNPQEIHGAIQAQKRDSLAMIRFLFWLDGNIKNKISEIDAAKKLETLRMQAGQDANMPLKDLAFDTIAASAMHGAIIHYRVDESSNRILQEGELFLLDSGAQYQDGTTDITRTIAIAEDSYPLNYEYKYYYTLVLKALIHLSLTRFPDKARGCDLDSIARHVLWQAHADYGHGTGHGVGSYLCVHEGPQALSPYNTQRLYPGMILSNEPGYYRENAFGIRLENLLLVQQEVSEKAECSMLSFKTLTYCPFDRRLIIKEILDNDALIWLNNYHKFIYQEFSSLINEQERAWLFKATQEI